MQDQAETDSEIIKARNAARDELAKAVVTWDKMKTGELTEEEEVALSFPGLRELPANLR